MTYTIGEAAKTVGIAPSALRFYEKEGLLPPADRTEGGRRIYDNSSLEWLKIIECLKKTGMPLEDIKSYIAMAKEGDATIEERLQMFEAQRAAVLARMEELNGTLQVIDYKIWFYETAKAHGGTAYLADIPEDEIPERHRAARNRLKAGAGGNA